MSYNIRTFKLTENNKSALKLIPAEMRDDIKNGYYPYELDSLLPEISKGRKILLEVNGDYGHYFELWDNGKKKKINTKKVIKDYLDQL